uniref:Glutathione S-transferase n=1 Tax=viral metagenome TaxID=1070528 RepID=A0A6C0F9N8_9ZZZZ|tara:strand:+ start:2877 stop:3509 length:633 start_codon:yes stop_codon:yes gene_type:complete
MKLVYFNGRGMAETSRLLLAAAGCDYEDFRYPLEIIDMKTYKFKRDDFDNDKKNGFLKKSMGKVPFLMVNGKTISQSKSIERYISEKFCMSGENDEDKALIDSYCEYLRDFKTLYQKSKKNNEVDVWFSETLPSKLLEFEILLNENKYNVNDDLTLSDISIYSFLCDYFDNKEGVLNSYKECKILNSIVKKVIENKRIANWIKNRPKTSF